jgi:hypothetical protein
MPSFINVYRYLLFLSFFITAPAFAATYSVANCTAANINAAISAASDGDTVLLTCTGTVTWTERVEIPATKGIALLVQGATNIPPGAPTFPLTVVSQISPALLVRCGSNRSVSRVSGFKFQTPGTVTLGDVGFLNVNGQGIGKSPYLGAYRIDNIYFDQISGNAILTVFSDGGPLYGLIDHNTFHDCYRGDDPDYGPYGIQVWNYWKSDGKCWGKDGWNTSFKFGYKNFVFIEDNLFENLSQTPNRYMRHYISSELGGRYVARNNTFTVNVDSPSGNNTDLIEGHGFCMCESNGCGTRGAEVYNNTFNGTKMGRVVMPRGGQWLIYNNTFGSLGTFGNPIYFFEYRAGSPGDCNQCSLTCPCSSNWHTCVGSDPALYPLEQQITGTYVWNNLYNGTNVEPYVDAGGSQRFYIQANRDYFVSASKPAALSGYTAYPYPHPLISGVIPPASGKVSRPPSDILLQ